MSKFSPPSATAAAACIPTTPKLSYCSLLIKAVKSGTYDEIKGVVLSEAADRGYNEKSVAEYNSLVNDALTLAIIFQRLDVLTHFIESYAIDYAQPNSKGRTLSFIIDKSSSAVKNTAFLGEHLLKAKTKNYEAHLEKTLLEYFDIGLESAFPSMEEIEAMKCPIGRDSKEYLASQLELLLVQNFHPSTKNDIGASLFMLFAHHNLLDACEVALSFINTKSKLNILLAQVMERNYLTLIPLLISLGADINATAAYGQTILMHACFQHNSGIINTILDHGAKINAVDHVGNTALMNFIDKPSICKLLLDRKADVKIVNKGGDTALMMAQDGVGAGFRGCAETYELLLKHIAELEAIAPIGEESASASTSDHC
jgi:ankyrin repeat protein